MEEENLQTSQSTEDTNVPLQTITPTQTEPPNDTQPEKKEELIDNENADEIGHMITPGPDGESIFFLVAFFFFFFFFFFLQIGCF